VSGFRCQEVEVLNTENSYETHSWNSEPQNIEQEISNDEVWNRCAQFFLKIIMIEYLTSTFDIRYSAVLRFAFSVVSYEDLAPRFPDT
jgi:hypothetical protein